MNGYSFNVKCEPFKVVRSRFTFWCAKWFLKQNPLLFSYYLARLCLDNLEGKEMS